jgi:hypothetical protein
LNVFILTLFKYYKTLYSQTRDFNYQISGLPHKKNWNSFLSRAFKNHE